jgi:hypothetical protein
MPWVGGAEVLLNQWEIPKVGPLETMWCHFSGHLFVYISSIVRGKGEKYNAVGAMQAVSI